MEYRWELLPDDIAMFGGGGGEAIIERSDRTVRLLGGQQHAAAG